MFSQQDAVGAGPRTSVDGMEMFAGLAIRTAGRTSTDGGVEVEDVRPSSASTQRFNSTLPDALRPRLTLTRAHTDTHTRTRTRSHSRRPRPARCRRRKFGNQKRRWLARGDRGAVAGANGSSVDGKAAVLRAEKPQDVCASIGAWLRSLIWGT